MNLSRGRRILAQQRRGLNCRQSILTFAGLAVVVVSACNRAGPAKDGYWLGASESGIPWARNRGSGSWPEDGQWIGSVSMTLGRQEGEGPEVFGNIWALAVDSSEVLYLLDDLAQEIRVFDKHGAFLRRFGRRGEGPGEFGYADGLTLGPEGNLWVYDPRRQRISVFRPNGTFLRQVPRQPVGSITPWPAQVLPDGTVVDWNFSLPERDYGTRLGNIGSVSLYEPIQIQPQDGRVDAFPGIELRFPMVGGLRVPFAAHLAFSQNQDGSFWFSHPTEYRFYRRSLAGDTLFIVSLDDAQPARVTGEEADSVNRSRRTDARALRGSLRDLPIPADLPDRHPVIQRMVSDGAGHLLVFPRLEGAPPGTLMDVFVEKTGVFLGRVELPVAVDRHSPVRAVPGRLYAVVRGNYDVQRLVKIDLWSGSRKRQERH